ncbi:MAG: phosphate/phosphite/phosphonate ABC transporter substrate-binding protein [Myxococcaceae bacterium]|nr:phosphate/phosphite/phosphonate ABC transporter substrate-binding protein [Myxococcaceae bacterium]
MRDPRGPFRFALPPSLGAAAAGTRGTRLESYLNAVLGRATSVVVPASYEALARELLAGRVDSAWAPPFVCARIEAMGVRVLVRGVRNGASTYRAALMCKKGAGLELDVLAGKRAVWADRDSVGGYLLPMALLRSKGQDPGRIFLSQGFAGSYRAALEVVLRGDADVTSIFAPAGKTSGATGLAELWPEKKDDFEVVGFTEESPNDGVAVAVGTPAALVTKLEQVFTALHDSDEGRGILHDTFNAERFESAPRMGYRALYRVALASL